jgi:hypothetical protein
MKRSLTLFLLIYTSIGLLASLIVHFLLYFGISLYEAAPSLWLAMQFGVLVGLVGLFLLKPANNFPKGLGDITAPRLFVAMVFLACFFFFYTPVNFFYCQDKLKEGYPTTMDGQPVLFLYHGAPPQRLTPDQFREAKLYQARKTSGHWMIVQMLPLIALYQSYKWGKPD